VDLKILVTGASGFLGRQIVETLGQKARLQVFAPNRSNLDLSDLSSVRTFWEENRPDVLIHAAAFARGLGGNLAAREAAFIRNEEVVRTALLGALEYGVQSVIFVGTVAEYAHPYANLPIREEDIHKSLPHSGELYYGLAKRLANPFLEAIRARWGASVVHCYLTNLYGPGDRFDVESGHVVASMLQKIQWAKEQGLDSVALWGSPSTTRDFLYVRDAAKLITELSGQRFEDLLEVNVASGLETTMGELAKEISNVLGFSGEVLWDSTKPTGISNRSVDTQKISSLAPFTPINLGDGLAKTASHQGWI
jgi:GDP-L-fucose synthase